MTEADKSRFQQLIDGLRSKNRDQKLLAIDALGILGKHEHAGHLTDLLASPDHEVVEHVIRALGKIGEPGSVKYILEFVVNNSENLANVALEVLEKMNLAKSLEHAVKAASSELPPVVRAKVLRLLIPYGDRSVAALMNEVMGQTRDSDCLVAAISFFIRFPSPEQHTSLKMLSSDKDWAVSLSSLIALSRLKDEGAVTQLKRLLKSGNVQMRQMIVDGLNQYPMIEDRSIYQLLFEDSNGSIRQTALEGLIMFAADERISIIRNWLVRETDKKIYLQLLQRAALEKSPLLYNDFFHLLQSSDEAVRNKAIEAISNMGHKVQDRILIDFDRMPLMVKEQMVLVLGRIKSEKVIKTVKECLFAKERWLRINAVEAAALIDADELNIELEKILKSNESDIWVRATAVSAIGRSQNKKFTDVLVPQLKSDDARVRANAIEALSELEWAALPEACHRMLEDKNDRVRVNAAIALWKSGHGEVFDELEKMSQNRSRWVRASAAYALGRIKDMQGTPTLLKMLDDSEDIVYRNAIEALAEMGDLRALMPLLRQSANQRFTPDFYQSVLNKFAERIHY